MHCENHPTATGQMKTAAALSFLIYHAGIEVNVF